MTHLTLIRHGQSAWNLENRFTGWVDVPLTKEGVAQARKAGGLIADTGVTFQAAYTSVLTRAIHTMNLILEEMETMYLPVVKDWRLNERHYGGLTGLDKKETAQKHGDEQVHIWRRSFDVLPPVLEDPSQFPSLSDARYPAGIELPKTESLKTTLDRVGPYWEAEILPRLAAGENLMIAAHGNSLRALVKILMNVDDDDIMGVEIPTGNPILFDLKNGSVDVVSAAYLDQDRAGSLPDVKG